MIGIQYMCSDRHNGGQLLPGHLRYWSWSLGKGSRICLFRDQPYGPTTLLYGGYRALFLIGWWVKLSDHLRIEVRKRIRELLPLSYIEQSGVIPVTG